MRNAKTLVIIAFMVMITFSEISSIVQAEEQSYYSTYEGAMITNAQQSEVYLLKDGFKHHVETTDNNVLWWKIYNSNGNRYVTFSQSDIDKIPEDSEVSLTSAVDNPVVTPVQTANVPATTAVKPQLSQVIYPTVTSTPVISNSGSWTSLRGESCWSSGENLGSCAGRVTGRFFKAFFKGVWNSG